MRSELQRIHRELGTTIIYVTHDQVEALTMARLGIGGNMHLLRPDGHHHGELAVGDFLIGQPPGRGGEEIQYTVPA